uniref:Putative secreted protein n=1 Tax=Ixodes ricinus TaxID=34613 RepID=V5GIR8_IXORI
MLLPLCLLSWSLGDVTLAWQFPLWAGSRVPVVVPGLLFHGLPGDARHDALHRPQLCPHHHHRGLPQEHHHDLRGHVCRRGLHLQLGQLRGAKYQYGREPPVLLPDVCAEIGTTDVTTHTSGYVHPEGPPPTGLVSVCDRIEEGRRHQRREQIPDVAPRTTDPRLRQAISVALFIASLSRYRAAFCAVVPSFVGYVVYNKAFSFRTEDESMTKYFARWWGDSQFRGKIGRRSVCFNYRVLYS